MVQIASDIPQIHTSSPLRNNNGKKVFFFRKCPQRFFFFTFYKQALISFRTMANGYAAEFILASSNYSHLDKLFSGFFSYNYSLLLFPEKKVYQEM